MLKHGCQSGTFIAGGTQTLQRDKTGTTIDVYVDAPNNQFTGAENPITATWGGVVT